MIQDDMIREVQELKLAGYTPKEVHEELRKRLTKAPTLKTVCNAINQGATESAIARYATIAILTSRLAILERWDSLCMGTSHASLTILSAELPAASSRVRLSRLFTIPRSSTRTICEQSACCLTWIKMIASI